MTSTSVRRTLLQSVLQQRCEFATSAFRVRPTAVSLCVPGSRDTLFVGPAAAFYGPRRRDTLFAAPAARYAATTPPAQDGGGGGGGRGDCDCQKGGAEPEEPKLGLVQRFKQMYRNYWYVLVPVHLVTSAGWFGGFYYMAKSGVDVVALLQGLGLGESWTQPLASSSMGHLAIAYALYKLATPLRYTVTLAGTTLSINYLRDWGYIKPLPSKQALRQMYEERRDTLRDTLHETRAELRQRKHQLRERKDNILGDYANFKKEVKDIGKHK